MRVRLYYSLVLGVLAGLVVAPVSAEGPGIALQRVDASQFPTVRAYVSVSNSAGVPIAGLDQQAFQVHEDGKPVGGLQVESILDSQEPVALALVIDTSGSMEGAKLDQAKAAAAAFFETLGVNDRVSIVSFADTVNVVQDPTGDRAALAEAVKGLNAGGETHLYDAVAETSRRQASLPQRRKSVLVLTDGEDTKSSASLENSIAAAVSAGGPVFAVGLGSQVSRDALDKLASATGGQAIYVDDPAQLAPTFRSIGDQLRRLYVLRYASKLASDDKAHGLAVAVAYSGQQATGIGSFTIPAPVEATIFGLGASGPVSGVLHITVDVPGGAQLVQLFVDDQPRGATRTAPFAFDWDTTRDSPGPHRVVVRITNPQGGSSDKPYSVTVAEAASVSVAPTSASVPPSVSQPAPTPAFDPPRTAPIQDWLLPAGLLLLLLIAGVGAWILATPRGRPAPPAKPAAPAPTYVRSDLTDIVDTGGAGIDDATYVRPPEKQPRARLLVVRHGQQREVEVNGVELTFGRDDASDVPIKDALASRKHCRVWHENGAFWIEDLGSLNGTQVNGEPIRRRQLANDDRISIGETVMRFELDPR